MSGISIYPSRNYGDRATRCGVSDQRIEPGEQTIYVRTGSRGRDAKPRPLFEMMVDALRRGGWEEIIAPALGLEVRLVRLPNDEIVILGVDIVYTADYDEQGGYNRYCSARFVAEQIAEALGTHVEVWDLTVHERLEAFMAEHGIDPEEWTYQDFATAVLGVPVPPERCQTTNLLPQHS